MRDPVIYREVAERSWGWVLTQVRRGDGGVVTHDVVELLDESAVVGRHAPFIHDLFELEPEWNEHEDDREREHREAEAVPLRRVETLARERRQ